MPTEHEHGRRPDTHWYRLGPDEVLDRLEAGERGLDGDEPARRREEYGENRLREPESTSVARVLLDQFTSPLIYVLLAALVITLAIGDYTDAIVVAFVLTLNATIGSVQEYRAQTAVQALMELVSPRADVRRDGERQEIDAAELVPGDIVLLTQGTVVPADVRVLDARGLRVDESALTGESVPAGKTPDAVDEANLPPADQRGMAFMGTAVTSGEATTVVVATGRRTEIGRISAQVEAAKGTETPLQTRIDRLAKWITVGVLFAAVIAFAVGIAIGRSVDEMLLLSVALAVGAIPEGLPVVVTVALAIGVHRMARRNALIRQLAAVDTLGSCTVILSDKTGTLTENRMTVDTVLAGGERIVLVGVGDEASFRHADAPVDVTEHRALYEALLVGALCNDASLADDRGDPMEIALLVAARRAGLDREELERRHALRDEVPFRTERRYMATIHDADDGDGPLVLVKGAPERVGAMCDRRRAPDGGDVPLDPGEVVDEAEQLASDGLRTLAMAVGRGDDAATAARDDDPSGFTYVGLQGLVDPPRRSAVEAVDHCHEAGIRVAMVTGDHAATAAAIGQQVHIVDEDESVAVCTGREIAELSDDELDGALHEVRVFARVAPEQKHRLVERLKARHEIVAVTGDGVNDAPALEAAHLGVAMGSGTDVAKEASQMVITDDDFASVYAAVEEGRTAFRNIRMTTFFLLSTGGAEVILILAALALDWPLPLLPAQILWLNVVTNGIQDVALAFEPGERALFARRPRPVREGILDRTLLERLGIIAVWFAIVTLAVFWWQWDLADEPLKHARTATLTTLVLLQTVHVFNCRSEDVSVFHKSLLANKVLFFGVLVSLAVHVGAMHFGPTQEVLRIEPLGLSGWLVAIGAGLTAIAVNDLHKRLRTRRGDAH